MPLSPPLLPPADAPPVLAATAFHGPRRRAEPLGVPRRGAGAVGILALALAATSCRPGEKAQLGGDSTRTAGPPEMAAESLPAGHAVPGSGFTKVGAVVGLSGPESVRYDPAQDVYFVSNFTGTLAAKDNTGFIARVRPDGSIDSLKFIAGGRSGVTLNAPTGMALTGDTLWVADVTVVRAFNARTGAPVAAVDLGPMGARLLNDVAVGPDRAVYITDTGIRFAGNGAIEHPGPDRVFRLGPNGRAAVALGPGTVSGPNGIAWDSAGRRFLVVSFTGPRIYGWTPGESRARTIAQGPGRFDGVVVLGDGRALVTSWADSSLYVLHGDTLTRAIAGLPEPADIGLDPKRHRVAIPVSSENRVEFWQVPGT